jgi:glyoxylase-like metal-dependent hydrolase (beta-lactamase superfamily II)
MNVERIGNRGYIFDFNEYETTLTDTIVYGIKGETYFFICDTQTGPNTMKYVLDYLKYEIIDRRIVVFNSHADWDHIWGNCIFDKNSVIISSEACREDILFKGEYDLKYNYDFINGDVVLKLPDITFESKLFFDSESVEFFYLPGHTIGDSVCFDKKDRIMYIGDLAEVPIPCIGYHDLKRFKSSLECLLDYDDVIYLTTHSKIVDKSLIMQNIDYIESLIKGKDISSKIIEEYPDVVNIDKINRINVLMDELIENEKIKKKDGEDFDLFEFELSVFKDMGYTDLKKVDHNLLINLDYDEFKKFIINKIKKGL